MYISIYYRKVFIINSHYRVFLDGAKNGIISLGINGNEKFSGYRQD